MSMNEKQIKKQLKKIRKNWPDYLKPELLPNGQLRVIRSLYRDDLESLGISNIGDLIKKKFPLEESTCLTQQGSEVSQKLVELWVKIAKETDPEISAPLLENYFPGIFDEVF